jgi:hypothetical protein
MTTPPEGLSAADYELSGEELDRQFEMKVKPQLEGPARVQPTWVVFIGQLAAGKTTAMSAAPRRFDLDRPGTHDPDWLVHAHPEYPRLRELYGSQTARTLTGSVIRPITDRTFEFAQKHRRDMVMAASGISADWYRRRFGPAREAGFRVEVVCVATHEAWSTIGTVARYVDIEEQHPGHGEWFDRFLHDLQYPRLPEALHTLEDEGLVDGTHIALRGGRYVYSNSLRSKSPVQWEHEPRAAAELGRARRRLWPDHEHQGFRLLAERLLKSPITTQEQKAVVVDAIVRSLGPNRETMARLIAEGSTPELIERHQGHLDQLTALAQEWAGQQPPWYDRPDGHRPSSVLRSTIAETFQQYTTGFDRAARLREQIRSLQSVDGEPGAQPAREGINDAQRRLDGAQIELDHINQQLRGGPVTVKKAQLELTIRGCLPPDRAASEEHDRQNHLRQQDTSAGPGVGVAPENRAGERDDMTAQAAMRTALPGYPRPHVDVTKPTQQPSAEAAPPRTPRPEAGTER